MTTATRPEASVLTITAPNLVTAGLRIVGVAPYMQAKFSEKSRPSRLPSSNS